MFKSFSYFQDKVSAWLLYCFAESVCTTRKERTFRFLEESLELCQSLEMSKEDAISVVDYVYGRDKGEPHQDCLLYTSPSPRDLSTSRMPSSA